ncbi:hypothetical protein LJ737_21815 [Hymenobacter sp. 15J16-1T3B]|nr:hypothetical protein [Hymenobacter sp. 15J16-1T3B]MCC3159893.1 hypothetical protein [Hymenobacter sp. 15J16-1T3B]
MITPLQLFIYWAATTGVAGSILSWTNSVAAGLEACGRLLGALLDLILA